MTGPLYEMARQTLAKAGIENPDLEARWLIEDSGASEEAINAALARRLAGEPLARIAGYREFWGLRFQLSPATLEPRPDSEMLIETLLRYKATLPAAPLILDMGTGTGCLLLAALHALPAARGIGVDRSPEAAVMARRNAASLGLSMRSHFVAASWGSALNTRVDVILANPPYISRQAIATLTPAVRDYDPHLALDGGDDGLDCYRALLPDCLRLLNPGGLLLLEIGFDQAETVPALLPPGLKHCETVRDYGGQPRVVVAERAKNT